MLVLGVGEVSSWRAGAVGWMVLKDIVGGAESVGDGVVVVWWVFAVVVQYR